MLDYDFYQYKYFGSAIPESAFSAVAARAEAALSKLKRTYRVVSPGEQSEKLALCAMADAIYAYDGQKPGVSQVRMGEVSLSYRDGGEKALTRELVGKASVYLDLYRGVTI
ncbi:MAG: hypothetical protein IJD63_01420 [Oscillospiraceae bacterium]|nr:hypothetical protein [Oscillospiraceae bacterium]